MGQLLGLFEDVRGERKANEEKWASIWSKQNSSWDCGIACTTMCLKWSNAADQSPLLFDKSTPLWTIDLFVFLRRRGFDQSFFYTTCPGINRDHFEMDWYKNHIDTDVVRVEQSFNEAREKNWPVEDAISLLEVGKQLAQGGGGGKECVVILLVDNNILKLKTSTAKLGYAGHYILLVDFDLVNESFLYLDPSSNFPIATRIPIDRLLSAHLADGTDRDLIIIKRSF